MRRRSLFLVLVYMNGIRETRVEAILLFDEMLQDECILYNDCVQNGGGLLFLCPSVECAIMCMATEIRSTHASKDRYRASSIGKFIYFYVLTPVSHREICQKFEYIRDTKRTQQISHGSSGILHNLCILAVGGVASITSSNNFHFL